MKPHVSATQLDMFAKCPQQYYRRYVAGERRPPSLALGRGKAFHEGAEHNMRQKVESHVDLPVADIVDASVAAFDAIVAEGIDLDQSSGMSARDLIGREQDVVAGMARFHAHEQAPDYQPLLVEHEVRIELPGPRDLLGVIDLADDQGRVIDFKTSGKKKAKSEVDTSVQLTIYAAAMAKETGLLPSEVRLDIAAAGSRGIQRQVLSGVRTEGDVQAVANRIDSVSNLLEVLGDDPMRYPPAPPGSWWCGEKWCGYWNTCPFVNSERKALAEDNE